MNKNKEYKEVFEKILKYNNLSSFDAAHLHRTYQAITIEELDFVIENTTSQSVQDFALAKKLFYASKKASE